MSLPFLKPKHVAGVIISHRKADGGKVEEPSDKDAGLEAAAEDLARAITSKDPKHIALAFRNAFQICDSEPHEEGEHTNEEDNSYDSMNEKAARDQE